MLSRTYVSLTVASLLVCGATFAGVARATEPVAAPYDNTYNDYLSQGSQPVYGIAPHYNTFITTRAGDTIAADVYLPTALNGATPPAHLPTILQYTPYHKQTGSGCAVYPDASFFTPRGYAVVIADAVGEGSSSGAESDGILTPQEVQGNVDVISWIAKQSWSDGQVGQYGTSFPGFLTDLVAVQNPPALKAIFAAETDSDYYLDAAYVGGNFALENQVGFGGGFTVAYQSMPPTCLDNDSEARIAAIYAQRTTQDQNLIIGVGSHPDDGPYFASRSPYPDFANMHADNFQLGGWRDVFLRGTVRNYLGMNVAPGRNRYLMIGNYTHANFPDLNLNALMLAYFDHTLKHLSNLMTTFGPVRVVEQGTNTWESFPSWPPAGKATPFYLSEAKSGSATSLNDGSLVAVPTDAGSATMPLPDPTDGTTEGGEIYESDVAPQDQRIDEVKKLTYSSAPFTTATTYIGSPYLHVYASTTATDFEISAKLVDVAPDGTVRLIKEGWLRASHRLSDSAPTDLTPGTVYPFTVEVWPIGNTFLPGHRLRLDLATSDSPRTLAPATVGTATFFSGPATPSSLDMPLVAAATGSAGAVTSGTTVSTPAKQSHTKAARKAAQRRTTVKARKPSRVSPPIGTLAYTGLDPLVAFAALTLTVTALSLARQRRRAR